MFNMILLGTGEACMRGACKLRAAMRKEEASRSSQSNQYSNGPGTGKGRGKRQPKRDQVVDLRTILIHCAQAVAIDDRRNANELLEQIRPPAPSASSRPSAPPPSSSTTRAPAAGRTSSHARSPVPLARSALACAGRAPPSPSSPSPSPSPPPPTASSATAAMSLGEYYVCNHHRLRIFFI